MCRGRARGPGARDLLRGPLLSEFLAHERSQRLAGPDLLLLGAPATQEGLIVGPPGVVAAVRLTVALDLPVDALKALPDRGSDPLHALVGVQAIGDRDAVILGKEARRYRAGVRNDHAASIDEPQRTAARGHPDLARAAAAPRYPSWSSSKYLFFTAVGTLLGAYLGMRTLSFQSIRNHR